LRNDFEQLLRELARRTTPDDVAVVVRAFEENGQVRWEEYFRVFSTYAP